MKDLKKALAITLSTIILITAGLFFGLRPAAASPAKPKTEQCSNPKCTCTNCSCGINCTCNDDK